MPTTSLTILIILGYFCIGLALALSDFLNRPKDSNVVFLSRPRFVNDRSVSTAIVFVLVWPYKLFRKFL